MRSLGAIAGTDFSGVPTTTAVTVATGATASITITGITDTDYDEGLEAFEISISGETISSSEPINVNPRKALVFIKNTVRK